MDIKLKDIIIENNEKNKLNINYPVETISKKYGFINQEKFFGKKIASIDKKNYYITRKNLIAFNPSRINVGSIAIKKEDNLGLISPLYINFYLKNIIDKNYFMGFFGSSFFQQERIKNTLISVRESLTLEAFKNIKIPLIDINKQKMIGEFLSNIDKKIELVKQEINIWNEYKNNTLNKIFNNSKNKMDIKKKNIKFSYFLTAKKDEKILNIDEKKILSLKLNLKGVAKNKNQSLMIGSTNYFLRKKGEFIYGKQNFHNGAFAFVPKEYNNFYSSKDVPSLIFDEKIMNKMYFYYFLSRKSFYKKIENFMNGTGSKRLHENQLLELEIPLLDINVQKYIGDFFSEIDKNILNFKIEFKFLNEYKNKILNLIF